MAATFTEAPEVQEIATRLISEVSEHGHLAEAKIAYLFREAKTWRSKGKVTLGRAKKLAGDTRFLARDVDFTITINAEIWRDLTPAQRVALVDHELSHCGYEYDAKGRRKWTIEDHDVNEFSGVIRRHGLWMEDVKAFAKAVREVQQQLDIDDLARQEAAAASGGDIVSEVVARIPEAVREAARTDPRLRGVSVEVLPRGRGAGRRAMPADDESAREREEAIVT